MNCITRRMAPHPYAAYDRVLSQLRAALDPPIDIPEEPQPPTPGGPTPPEWRVCANCHSPHSTWQCPALWIELRRPVLTCDSCERVLPLSLFTMQCELDLCICDPCYLAAMAVRPVVELRAA